MILDTTGKSLEALSTSTASTDYYVNYVDHTSSGATPGSSQGNIASATTTTILAAPASSTYRQVKSIFIRNRSTTAAQSITIKLDVSGTEYHITPSYTLAPGDAIEWRQDIGWKLRDRVGRERTQALETSGYNGYSIPFYKIGTAAEAVGVMYCHSKDSGFPGAWAVGTPGLAGRATDGTTSTDNGCLKFPNAASGSNYLTSHIAASSVAHLHMLFDVLWVNSGAVVTTTTAQTVNSVAFPARDMNGSTNGEGVEVGLLVTTATTNAGAITNTTMSYTNSAGTAGHTATIASFPATAVVGTFVPFQLQAGDTGVQSIQSVTLGTSYAGGAISLVAFTRVSYAPAPVVNVGGFVPNIQNPGVKLWPGTCLLPFYLASATTATTSTGIITVMER